MPGDNGLEVLPDSYGLLVADHYAGRDLEVVQGQDSNSGVSADESSLDVNAHTAKARGRIILKTRSTIGLFIIILAVILGGVLGGVLGSRASSIPKSGNSNGTSISTVTGPSITTGPLPKAPTIHNRTNLAAVAWQTADKVKQHRVYYQSAINEICEIAWNSSSRSWFSQNNLGLAKNGTPISVVSGKTKLGIIVNLYFLHESGKVQEFVSLDGLRWEAGSLSTKNIIPAPSSKLAAARASNHDGRPESLLFVFQDDQNAFRLYNSTGNVWVDSRIPANPITASGVSLSRLEMKKYPEQLRLYYQTAPGNLVAADWVSLTQLRVANASVPGKRPGWNLNEDVPLSEFDMEAQLTSFTWGGSKTSVDAYGTFTGFPTFVGVLTSGSKGLAVINWFPRDKITYGPAYTPSIMKAVGNYSAVASDLWGSAYALNDSGIIKFAYNIDEDGERVYWTDQIIEL